jgi:tryptophan-rich sensory protein
VWLFLAITTGLSGAELYKLNDQEASTIFIALVFFFGTGWVISTRVCNQWVNVAYIVLLTLTAWWLYKRLGDFKDQTQAKRARTLLLPLLAWLLFSTALAGNALGALVFKPSPTWRTM